MDIMEKLRAKLNDLISTDDILYRGDILEVSQELDKHIVEYYVPEKKCS